MKHARVAALIALVCLGAAPGAAAQDARPLSTCFWEGPISTERPSSRGFDGRNFNFPEESATYWMARFHLADGAKVVLDGKFGHARYQSLNAYSGGAPTDSLPDFMTLPAPGSTNPFVAGNRRDLPARDYAVDVVNAAPPADGAARASNTLYAQPGANEPIEVFLRVYEPDLGRDLTGDAGLPDARLVLADGTSVGGDDACARVNDPNREIPVQTTPAPVWQAAVSSPGCDPATNPAYDPVRWERFFTLEYASLSVVSDCTQAGFDGRRAQPPEPKGGFYSNRDNAYIYAHLSRRFGPLFVVQGRMPTVPRTHDGERTAESTQLRFWSLCTGESRVTTRTPDCLADRQVPLTASREFTVVVSRAEDRPANATARCGVAWLDWGERGDAAGRPDYAALIMRNMLPAPGFAQAIQRVAKPGDEPAVMGEFFPKGTYSARQAFEGRGCAPSRLALVRRARPLSAHRGVVRIPLRCSAPAGSCQGRVRVLDRRRGRTLGSGRFDVVAAGAGSARVRLRRGALARGKSVRVVVRASGGTTGGAPLRARGSYVLRAR